MRTRAKKLYPQTCVRCGNKWDSKSEFPMCCPQCRSYSFDKPKESMFKYIVRPMEFEKD